MKNHRDEDELDFELEEIRNLIRECRLRIALGDDFPYSLRNRSRYSSTAVRFGEEAMFDRLMETDPTFKRVILECMGVLEPSDEEYPIDDLHDEHDADADTFAPDMELIYMVVNTVFRTLGIVSDPSIEQDIE